MGRCIKDRDVYLEQDPSKAVPTTPFELWTRRKPSLRHLQFSVCPSETRVFNPHEKKLDPKIISGYFIGYPNKSKGYRFYCPNHSLKIVETRNARFLENGKISQRGETQKIDLEKIRVDIPPFFPPQEIIVHQTTQQDENNEQYNGSPLHEDIALNM